MERYHVIRDGREKDGHGWHFQPSCSCEGTTIATLKTGDYTLRGLEKEFVIERKANTAEWAKNVLEPRFKREMERLSQYPFSCLIMEFTLDDIFSFPNNSGIPKHRWKYLKMSPDFLMKATIELQVKYNVQFIFAGACAQRYASSLFKRVFEHGFQAKQKAS